MTSESEDWKISDFAERNGQFFQIWFLEDKVLVNWPFFHDQQVLTSHDQPGSHDFNFIELFNFWVTNICFFASVFFKTFFPLFCHKVGLLGMDFRKNVSSFYCHICKVQGSWEIFWKNKLWGTFYLRDWYRSEIILIT